MIAAIYARKSTDQTGVADDQKSVARQVEHAKKYAASKGWTVADEYIYIDDGVSGAEFASRPGFIRVMNSLKPRPPYQVLTYAVTLTLTVATTGATTMSSPSRPSPRRSSRGRRAWAPSPRP